MSADEPMAMNLRLGSPTVSALAVTCALTGESSEDAVQRSVQLYAWWHEQIAAGGTILLRTAAGEVGRVKLSFVPGPAS